MRKRLINLLIIILISIAGSVTAQEEIVTETPNNETVNDSGDVFVFVEVTPKYPGGVEARLKYLRDNITYPKTAKESGIQGTVYITFVVEKDGSITNVKVLRGIGGGCDEEAVRVIKNMPKWKPGMQRGKAVRTQFNIPIRFVLADDSSSTTKTKKQLRKEKRKQKKQAKQR
jgi:protein TonB